MGAAELAVQQPGQGRLPGRPRRHRRRPAVAQTPVQALHVPPQLFQLRRAPLPQRPSQRSRHVTWLNASEGKQRRLSTLREVFKPTTGHGTGKGNRENVIGQLRCSTSSAGCWRTRPLRARSTPVVHVSYPGRRAAYLGIDHGRGIAFLSVSGARAALRFCFAVVLLCQLRLPPVGTRTALRLDFAPALLRPLRLLARGDLRKVAKRFSDRGHHGVRMRTAPCSGARLTAALCICSGHSLAMEDHSSDMSLAGSPGHAKLKCRDPSKCWRQGAGVDAACYHFTGWPQA